MKKILLSLIIACGISVSGYSQCAPGFSEIIVQIIPDSHPTETSWTIADNTGTIVATGGATGDTLCLADNECDLFTIHDLFGDGINSPGGYFVYVNGVLVGSGSNFGFQYEFAINCPAGSFCTNALPIDTGTYTGVFEDSWFTFTPTLTGTYNLSTCGLATCNTQIWMYTSCPTIPYQDNATGTYAYNDDNACGLQADMNTALFAGTTYLIRVGDALNSCTGSIDFRLEYVSQIQGCMDPLSCNYNPVAVIDDGSCIYPPNPLCAGPDLQVDSMSFINSLQITSHNANTCDVDEGCVTGYGQRYVLRFTSKINNIGTLDYYIGSPSSQPGMFNTNNCHGHAHYEGYGDYRLFNSDGNQIPSGHKNGYCVIDLCGFGQYTCGNMGITAGCYDAYGAGTQCQWLDLTDVPTGDYRVAIIINSKHLPDALGRYETNFANNALQVCMHIEQHPGGAPTFSLLPNCQPYVDCTGLPGGASERDCNGVCNGPGVYGDTYSNSTLDSLDVITYLDLIQIGLPPSVCYDISGDSSISVYDASLMNWCLRGNNSHPGGSYHNHCNFPRNIVNPSDLTGLSISNVNYVDNYFDVELMSPNANVKSFQFTISGASISSVVSLVNPIDFPVDLRFKPSTNEIFGISIADSSIMRSGIPTQLVRVYFNGLTDTVICISSINDIVNQDAERTVATVYGSCMPALATEITTIARPSDLVVIPNPAYEKAYIHISGPAGSKDEIEITDASGRLVRVPVTFVRDAWYEMDLNSLPTGVYFVIRKGNNVYGVTRFIKL
jgi:hypothetical protein